MPILGDQGADSGDKGKFQTDGKKWQKEKKKTGRRTPGDNVLTDQFQTVAALLASDSLFA